MQHAIRMTYNTSMLIVPPISDTVYVVFLQPCLFRFQMYTYTFLLSHRYMFLHAQNVTVWLLSHNLYGLYEKHVWNRHPGWEMGDNMLVTGSLILPTLLHFCSVSGLHSSRWNRHRREAKRSSSKHLLQTHHIVKQRRPQKSLTTNISIIHLLVTMCKLFMTVR